MTRFASPPLLLILTLTLVAPGLTLAETRSEARMKPAAQTTLTTRQAPPEKGFAVATPRHTQADDDGWCGNGEILVIYDEDENGNPVPGTEVYGCVYD